MNRSRLGVNRQRTMKPLSHFLLKPNSFLNSYNLSSPMMSESLKSSAFFLTDPPQSYRTSTSMMGMWKTVGSTLASLMFFWAIIRPYCPRELRLFFETYTVRFMSFFNPYVRISIHEFPVSHLRRSEAYVAVEAYVGGLSSNSVKRLKAEMGASGQKLTLTMDDYERVKDEFQGVEVWWVSGKFVPSSRSTTYPEPEKRYYRLTFHSKHREMITDAYLDHVVKMGKELRRKDRPRKLFTNSSKEGPKNLAWSHIKFDHPATFDTLAMETEKKHEIIEDLLNFRESKDYYARIGKTWKRGYLLYGPPGTGKSTMIAAMANLMSYDVYDLELTAVKDNTELRRLLIETTSKSIIVIEDIDCSLDLTGQRKNKKEKSSEDEGKGKKEESGSKVTLSGLLNFIDGLWSASGGERIIIFTTNHVEKLDPALTRRGRMDMHIELSYCSFEGFKVLAKNYLELETHPMFEEIEKLMETTEITPADVAENLMPKSRIKDAGKCLSNLIRALEEKRDAERVKEPPQLQDKQETQKTPSDTQEEETRDAERVKEPPQLQDKQETQKTPSDTQEAVPLAN